MIQRIQNVLAVQIAKTHQMSQKFAETTDVTNTYNFS